MTADLRGENGPYFVLRGASPRAGCRDMAGDMENRAWGSLIATWPWSCQQGKPLQDILRACWSLGSTRHGVQNVGLGLGTGQQCPARSRVGSSVPAASAA